MKCLKGFTVEELQHFLLTKSQYNIIHLSSAKGKLPGPKCHTLKVNRENRGKAPHSGLCTPEGWNPSIHRIRSSLATMTSVPAGK